MTLRTPADMPGSQPVPRPSQRRRGQAALTAIGVSIALIFVSGLQRPSAAERAFPAAPPLPPWSVSLHLSDVVVACCLWAAAVLGGGGLLAALAAMRRGWRPRPWLLISGSVIA